MEQKAQQPPPPNPAAMEAQQKAQQAAHDQQIEAQKVQADTATKQAQAQKDAAEASARETEAQTAAQDADVKRKIDVQRELDASDARKQEMADKARMAELQRAHAQEKHAQEMTKGQLDIRLLRTKIAATGAMAAAKANTQGQEDGTPSMPVVLPDDDGGDESAPPSDMVETMLHDLRAQTGRLARIMAAPTVVLRDQSGHVIGARKQIDGET